MSTLLFGVVFAGLVLVTDMRDMWRAVGRYVLDATVVACTTACVGFVVMTTSAREVPSLHGSPVMRNVHCVLTAHASLRCVLQRSSHACPDDAYHISICPCAHTFMPYLFSQLSANPCLSD